MSPRTLVVVNPASRSGAADRRFARLEGVLREALGPLEVERTKAPRDAERIAREGVRAGVERIVVVGGDGTASEVATGLLGADLGRYAAVGLIPLGTGGDLLRTLGVSRDPRLAIRELAKGCSRRIDAGRVEFVDHEGSKRTSYFLNVASVGVSGLICQLVNRGSKLLGGKSSFLLGTLRGLARYRAPSVSLEVDGCPVHEGPLVLAACANGRYFGGGMQIAPDARPDDGLLDVVVIRGSSKARLLSQLPSLYRGSHVRRPEVSHHRGRRMTARLLSGEAWLEIDGEPLGTTPVEIEILPGAMTMLGGSG